MALIENLEEQQAFWNALNSFKHYRQTVHRDVTHLRRQAFFNLPTRHSEILLQSPFNMLETFNAVDKAIDSNSIIAETVAQCAMADSQSFIVRSKDSVTSPDGSNLEDIIPTPTSLNKADSTIRQLYRDWSAEGKKERDPTYSRIFMALQNHFPMDIGDRHRIRTLVPGSGLGRLVYELVILGYTVEGNEISYHQLFTSSMILNHSQRKNQFELSPWAFTFSNNLNRKDQLQRILIPDVHPSSEMQNASIGLPVPAPERMSISAGDFCIPYRSPADRARFDAVVTLFFIDTAPNVIAYIEAVKNCLCPGGIWINIGPLLWHFDGRDPAKFGSQEEGGQQNTSPILGENQNNRSSELVPIVCTSEDQLEKNETKGIQDPGSVELCDEEIIMLLERFGFEIVEHVPTLPETGYILNLKSMMHNVYRPSFWIAKRSCE